MKPEKKIFDEIINFIQRTYNTNEFIHLHEPRFIGNEKKYLNECIDSTFVSSVGQYVTQFEEMVTEYTGSKYAVATANGTSALHIGLKILGVDDSCEVITQSLTFIATANAISYCNADPIFIDVDRDTLGLSPTKLNQFLDEHTTLNENGECLNKSTRKIIKACVPMHTFGHPCKIDEILKICNSYNIAVLEDSAESMGSFYKGKHTGSYGKMGIFSFNGNKIITTGSGGMLITDDEYIARKAKHLTTTAKVAHAYEFIHDEIGYNYRLSNISAALGVAQMENIQFFLNKKRNLAQSYENFFSDKDIEYFTEPNNSKSNYWLNAIVLKNREARDNFLEYCNANGVMVRPIWKLMNKLDMFKDAQTSNLDNSEWLEDRVVNISSSVLLK
tara:strand:- start:443 stop:1606 length:1164 start_codon:yes stop_codon:yes gene_type:complete